MRPVVDFGAAGAGADVGADAEADIVVGAGDDDGENNGTGCSGVPSPEGKTPPRGDSLCILPRSTGMSMMKSRAEI